MSARYVLVVDDEVGIRELLRDILEDEGYHVILAENAAQAREYRQQQQPNLVLLDIWMPDCDGVTLLKEWGSGGLLTMPVVMMSGHATVDTAVEATRIGAFDFLEKPIALQKLLKTVGAALKHGERMPQQALSLISLGKSVPILELRQRLEHAAALKTPLLLIGAKGCGVELCARALHKADTPLVVLENPEKLVHTPMELLEQAKGGLLFCQEISELSHSQQKGLQLLLQKYEKYDVRVVCTTSRDLNKLSLAHQFEDGLLQAVSALTVRVPTLDEHREDIPELARALGNQVSANGAITYREFDTAALNALRNATWPGNLAQLENVVQRLMLGSLGDVVKAEDVQRVLQEFDGLEAAASQAVTEVALPSPVSFDQPLREARDQFERLYIEHHIDKEEGNMSRVADAVGLERTHLYRKLKQLGIKIK